MKAGDILGAVAVALSAAALTVSLTHHGTPGSRGLQGPAGPRGDTGRDAEVAHLGVCVNIGVQTGVLYLPVQVADPITSPLLTDGVPSCPAGQFVSVVPQQASR